MNEHSDQNEIPAIEPEACKTPDYNNFGEALGAGRRAAAERAKSSVPKLKGAFEGAIHDVAYGGAFGVCFAAYFARELVPAGLRRNLSNGLERGKTAAKAAVDELRAEKEEAPVVATPAEV